jgi:hypothetical protein
MERTVGYVSLHRRTVTQAAIAGAVLLLLVAGFFAVRAYRENQAGKDLSEGLAALDVPIAGQPAAAGAPKTYSSAGERDKAAEVHLRKAAGMGGTVAGQAAAMILAARSASPDAAATLERLAREGKAEVAASAEIDAARLLAAGVSGAQGRAALRSRTDLRGVRLSHRRACDVPAPHQRLPELPVPRRRPPEDSRLLVRAAHGRETNRL